MGNGNYLVITSYVQRTQLAGPGEMTTQRLKTRLFYTPKVSELPAASVVGAVKRTDNFYEHISLTFIIVVLITIDIDH